MKKTVIISVIAVVIVAGGSLIFLTNSGPSKESEVQTVTVERKTIVDQVLAIGTIEPVREIKVKSKVSGIVSKIFNDAGSYVKKGDPLLEVKPDPTPTELAEATRLVSIRETAFETIKKEKERQEAMVKKGLISDQEYEEILSQFNTTKLELESANDKLSLLKQGRVSIKNTEFTSIIRAEIDGYVLEKMVEIGDPVVPSTTFQPGMDLMTLADMEKLIFKGTVDEANVGKIRVGMPVEFKIGALPKDTIHGQLTKISLKAEKQDNATNFDVEAELFLKEGQTLRAGYSANANIIIDKKVNVLSIPERVVTFTPDSTFVMILENGNQVKKDIITGLSDAINIEVKSGLDDSAKVVEPPVKTLQ